MNLPSRQECLDMLKKEHTPDNIIRHVLLIEKISVFLGEKLIEKGEEIDVDLVSRGALLHDLKKWDEIKGGKKGSHGIDAHDALKKKYPKLAIVVKKHMLNEILDGFDSWEEKIVHYADRRVNHDYMVTIDERFEYFRTRYPAKDESQRKKIYGLSKDLEKEIFERLDFEAEELATKINDEN
ncbi:MAG: hypothetical protein KKF44_07725 [Nanoarchaeota archaeon]|nr:hypothetical protein [Nanoarchaeota archaeon]